jgi:hypothetical protein
MKMFFTSFVAPSLMLVIAVLLASCSRDYGYSRTAFNGKFVDKTIEQGEDTAGKAESTETPATDTKVLVYRRKTFDQENGNAKDAAVKVSFKKNATGAFVYASVEFVPE